MSRFTQGQRVKVFCKIGLQKKESWQTFTFMTDGALDENVGLCLYGSVAHVDNVHRFPLDEIYSYTPLPMEKLDEFGKANIAELEQLIRSGCKQLLRDNQQPESIDVQLDDSIINVMPEFSVSPAIIEIKGIGTITEVAGWGVIRWVQTGGTYDNPPDVDEIPVGEARNNIDAAMIVVNALFASHLNGFRDVYCDQKMAQEFAKEEQNGN